MSASIVVLVVLVGFVVFAASGSGSKRPSTGESKPVSYSGKRLMTAREFEFFQSLRGALPEAVIHAQVAMAALVDVKGERSARNRFDRKIFDFVICGPDGDVLYVVELDDRSHDSFEARRRDRTKDEIAAAAGFRVVRYQSVRTDPVTLRRDFDAFVALAARPSEVAA